MDLMGQLSNPSDPVMKAHVEGWWLKVVQSRPRRTALEPSGNSHPASYEAAGWDSASSASVSASAGL